MNIARHARVIRETNHDKKTKKISWIFVTGEAIMTLRDPEPTQTRFGAVMLRKPKQEIR